MVMVEEEFNQAQSLDEESKKISKQDFKILKLIGEGANALVYKIEMKDSGKIFALKVMQKRDIKERNLVRSIAAER